MFPRREVNCRFYSTCLDLCIDSHAKSFTCRNCTEMEQRLEITFNEVIGAGMLLRSIFFQKRMERHQKARCPRCGKHHTVMAGAGASPRRFCAACNTHNALFYSSYDAGQHIEIRSARFPVTPIDDEPGVGGDD
jgi:hypothetical protein